VIRSFFFVLVTLQFFFFNEKRPHKAVGTYLQGDPITCLALENLIIVDKASQITKRSIAQRKVEQSGAWEPPPPHVGDLKTQTAPRSERK
jgi:hypothetical protein